MQSEDSLTAMTMHGGRKYENPKTRTRYSNHMLEKEVLFISYSHTNTMQKLYISSGHETEHYQKQGPYINTSLKEINDHIKS